MRQSCPFRFLHQNLGHERIVRRIVRIRGHYVSDKEAEGSCGGDKEAEGKCGEGKCGAA